MSYYNDLVFQLRLRRLPEQQITEVLQDVRNLSEQSGQAPQDQFGAASAYAEQFPKGESRSAATKATVGVLAVAITILGIDLVQALFTGSPLRIGGVRVFFVLLAVQLVTVVTAFAADHRLPKGFAPLQERRA